MTATIYTRTDERATVGQFEPLARNAYRVLGLTGDASQSAIYEAAAALRLAHKLGVAKTFPGDAAWLGDGASWLGPVSRTEADVRDALSRLSNPPQRIFERLFWFYEAANNSGNPATSKPDALTGATQKLLFGGKCTVRHDAALLSLASLPHYDPEVKNEGAWATTLTLWTGIVEGEEFWSLLVAADLKGDFEPLVTYGEIRELRARALSVVMTPLVNRAKDALARQDSGTCRRVLKLLRAAALPVTLCAGYENDILAPLEDEIEVTCRGVFVWAKIVAQGQQRATSRRETYDKAFAEYETKLRPSLKRMLDLAGADSHAARRVFESAASNLNDLATFYREIGETASAASLYQRAWTLAPPGCATLLAIEENLRPSVQGEGARVKTEEGYAAAIESELRIKPPRAAMFTQYLSPQKNVSEAGCTSSLLWVGLGILIFIILSRCGGSSSRRSSGLYNSYNYNLAMPRMTPQPMPTIDPAILERLRQPLVVVPSVNLDEPTGRGRKRRRERRAASTYGRLPSPTKMERSP
ncbi:MAG: hypothetical protein WCD76_18305 [Pyrinomonadaceae bacterium]